MSKERKPHKSKPRKGRAGGLGFKRPPERECWECKGTGMVGDRVCSLCDGTGIKS